MSQPIAFTLTPLRQGMRPEPLGYSVITGFHWKRDALMPKGNPSLRHHRPSGRAVVTLDGKDHYLGKFGSTESRESYHRLLADWMIARKAAESAPVKVNASTLSIVEILSQFWEHAQTHYRRV